MGLWNVGVVVVGEGDVDGWGERAFVGQRNR